MKKIIAVKETEAKIVVDSDQECPITMLTRAEIEQIYEPTCCQDKGNFISLPDLIQYLGHSGDNRCPCCQIEGIRDQLRGKGHSVPTPELVRCFPDRIAKGDLEGVTECLEAGCNVNKTSDSSMGILTGDSSPQPFSMEQLAAFPQSQNTFIRLPRQDVSPISLAVSNRQFPVFQKLLSQEQIEVNKPDSKGNTPLLCAVDLYWSIGDSRFFDALIARTDIGINLFNEESSTALSVSCEHELLPAVEKLFRKPGLKVNAEDLPDTTTPLFCACQRGSREIVALLLSHEEIDVNKETSDGSTPLTIAICRHPDIALQLLEHPKIQVDLAATDGNTPLILAITREDGPHMPLIRRLHTLGADPKATADDGASAISLLENALQHPSPDRAALHDTYREILSLLKS
jgi:ankyrin repeat protein